MVKSDSPERLWHRGYNLAKKETPYNGHKEYFVITIKRGIECLFLNIDYESFSSSKKKISNPIKVMAHAQRKAKERDSPKKSHPKKWTIRGIEKPANAINVALYRFRTVAYRVNPNTFPIRIV